MKSGAQKPFDASRRSLFAVNATGASIGRAETVDVQRSTLPDAVTTPGSGGERMPAEWRPGEVLAGRYVVVRTVGEGGMGRVYRASDALHPERDLALKTLSTSFMQARLELFKLEFRTMSELSHPNIARVYDFETGAGGSTCFFTMEFIEGRDLMAASQGASLEQIVAWTVEASRALRYLHSRGVIHADLKPQNVMVTASGDVKVLDFGLSGVSGAGLLLGTPAYMAPELVRGPTADARVDLYALGITLYQMIFRRVPFAGASVHEILHLHAHAPLTFPQPLPAPMRAVIERLCAKRPEDRFAGANEVIEALAGATGRAYAPETLATRRSYVSSARLVGRDAAKQQLVEHFLARAEGRGGDAALIATIHGPSGVGKSRLMREVRRQLQLVGVPFVEAGCYEGGFGELAPLQEWCEALARLGRAHGVDAVEREHAAALAWLSVGEPSGRNGSMAEEESLRMGRLRDLADFMLDLAASLGFVLFVDDLQWGRSATTDFLKLLHEREASRREAGGATRLALAVSYRDDEVTGRPLAQLLDAVPVARRVDTSLAPLGPAETAELIGSMLGTPDVPAAFSTRVSGETGGNPFFIEEVLRVLMERGDVYLRAGRWAARTEVARLDVPTTIAAVLERRLSAIEPRERELLAWLAAYAQPMPLHVLAETSGLSLDATMAGVRQLAERRMVASVGPERVRPAHDKLREYVYERDDRRARLERHRDIARTLDRLAAGDGDYVFERAHHYWHAEDAEQAYRWSEKAAALGEQTFAIDVAIDNHERVRALAEGAGDEARRRAATDRLLELCTVTGHYDRILAVSEVELGRRTERLERARLHQLAGEALGGQGKVVEGLDRLRQATALLGGRVPRSRAWRRPFIAWHYLRHLATLKVRRGDVAVAAPLGEAARRRREILAWCYLLMSIYSMLMGDDEGVGVSFAGLNAAVPLGRYEVTRRLLQNVALVHHMLGHDRASERLIREARAMAGSDLERALVLPTEVFARQMTQRPIYAGQLPVQAYEADIVRAIDLLSTRSKALYANMARLVATTIVCQYAGRYQYRPEVFRWADAMRGTLHYGYVQGGAAVMALIDGRRQSAVEAYALAQQGNAPPAYRVWLDASFAYTSAVVGETALAVRCMYAVHRALETMTTRAATSLWIPAFAIAACIALEARGATEPWLRGCLEECVGRLDRIGRRRPAAATLFHEAGRTALGRSTLAALTEAKRVSLEDWSRERSFAGHPNGCLVAALALRSAREPSDRAAARGWAEDAMRWIEDRFPASYADHVRDILGLARPA